MAHTPGPWHVHPNGCFIIGGSNPIASVGMDCLPSEIMPPSDEDAANARLIAAAPEMLQVLKEVLGCPQAMPWLARLTMDNGMTVADAVYDVVCKAEGREAAKGDK